MAWRSSGSSNSQLVENLWSNQMITDRHVKEAFLKVDRKDYAPVAPYNDSPQSIGYSATISAPHMHALALQHLADFIKPSSTLPAPRVLDVGSGSGYLTHVMAELAGDTGVVVGVEHLQSLKEQAERNTRRSAAGRAMLESGRLRYRLGDGRRGWPHRLEEDRLGMVARELDAVYDAIHVGASAIEVHAGLIAQLKAPGRIFIPVDDDDGGKQYVWTVDKDAAGNVTRTKLFEVQYVPLTDASHYHDDRP